MIKSKLQDITFIFLVRLDSVDRLENLLAVTNFLKEKFETNIHVLECAPFNNGLLDRLLDKSIRYSFQEDNDPILHRTKYLNQMIRMVETQFVAVWDTDVLVAGNQILDAIKLLQNGESDVVYPYDNRFLETTAIIRKLFLKENKFEVLDANQKKMKELYAPNPVGGAFIIGTKKYTESGLENEDFYGWGMEDGERYYRWLNLGYRIKRMEGPLFHLSHGRGLNSVFHNSDQQFYKRKEVLKVKRDKSISSTRKKMSLIINTSNDELVSYPY